MISLPPTLYRMNYGEKCTQEHIFKALSEESQGLSKCTVQHHTVHYYKEVACILVVSVPEIINRLLQLVMTGSDSAAKLISHQAGK